MQRASTNCVTFYGNRSSIVIDDVNQVDTDKHLTSALQLQCRNKHFVMVSKELMYLYKVVLFTLLSKETNQTVLNPSNLLQNG